MMFQCSLYHYYTRYPFGETLQTTNVCWNNMNCAAFLTCILPISVTRLIGLRGDDVPEIVWIVGMLLLFSLGKYYD
jgi:hypothetical protein